jgi:hypothetical protein
LSDLAIEREAGKEKTSSRKDAEAPRNAKRNSFSLFVKLCVFAPSREIVLLFMNSR